MKRPRLKPMHGRHAGGGFTLIELLVALFIAAIMFAMGYGAITQALHSRGSIRENQKRLLALQKTMLILEQDFVQLAPRPIRSPEGEGWLPAIMTQAGGSDASLSGSSGSDPFGSPSSGFGSTSSGFGSTSSGFGSTSSGFGSNGFDSTHSNSTSSHSTRSSATAFNSGTGSDSGPGSESSSAPLVEFTRDGWSNPIGVQRPELERVAYVFEKGTLIREHWNELDPTLGELPVKRDLLKHLRSVHLRYLDFNHQWVTRWPPPAPGGNQSDTYLRLRPLAVEVTLDTRAWGKIVRIFEVAG